MSKYPSNWGSIRQKILRRDGRRCYFCESRINLNIHHLRPLAKGGNHESYNLLTLCAECHRADHRVIRSEGLSTVPGPDHEKVRGYLTDYADVERYCDRLEDRGRNADDLREKNYQAHKRTVTK